ncbi:hypothetical protein EYF80_039226 [Liparis tanakae]|uniref:Uncharacterized protein n=1 Tax=Liparis tanakae TaxID=230148 RepID=A0A4Z2GAF8_9TELE|nr:hypothetical protein EYF80_039226 [Liparis tanakae]
MRNGHSLNMLAFSSDPVDPMVSFMNVGHVEASIAQNRLTVPHSTFKKQNYHWLMACGSYLVGEEVHLSHGSVLVMEAHELDTGSSVSERCLPIQDNRMLCVNWIPLMREGILTRAGGRIQFDGPRSSADGQQLEGGAVAQSAGLVGKPMLHGLKRGERGERRGERRERREEREREGLRRHLFSFILI